MDAWNGKPPFGSLLEFSLDSYTCTYGWGAHYEGSSTGSHFWCGVTSEGLLWMRFQDFKSLH